MNGPDRLPFRAILLGELLATPAAARYADDPNRSLLASMIAGLFIPLGAQAAEADLMKKIDAMAKEIESLRAQVQAHGQAR